MTKRLLLVAGWALISTSVHATSESESDSIESLLDLSLEELMDVSVVVSSGRREQKEYESASPITVITKEDIHYSGLTTIPDILRFYTGMDVLRHDRHTSLFVLSIQPDIKWACVRDST